MRCSSYLRSTPTSRTIHSTALYSCKALSSNRRREEPLPLRHLPLVQIYGRHVHSWIPDINFSDIAIRGQLYILWKTAWQERTSPIDRDAVLVAAALTLHDIEKDNKKWERNYSAARRRDWHPNFTAFYDDVFKGQWTHKIWSSQGALPGPILGGDGEEIDKECGRDEYSSTGINGRRGRG